MTPLIPESVSTWLADWNLVTIVGDTVPPRDPNDDEDDDDAAEDDSDDTDDDEPAVIREPVPDRPAAAGGHRGRSGQEKRSRLKRHLIVRGPPAI